MEFRLTTDHSSSSYGQPVALDEEGEPHGSGDVVPGELFMVGEESFDTWAEAFGAAQVEFKKTGEAFILSEE